MALINCPKVGHQSVSRQVLCPAVQGNCFEADSIICEECKTKYSSDLASCPQCGHPTPHNNKKKSKKSRKTLALVFIDCCGHRRDFHLSGVSGNHLL